MVKVGRVGVVVALVAAMTGALSPSGGAAPKSVDPESAQESVRYLVKAYGVSEQEALRRLELQRQADGLDEVLRRDAGA